MKTTTHGNGRGLDDLYILPDDASEWSQIVGYLKSRSIAYQHSLSDVEGQDWFGKQFIEIPFGEGLRSCIEQACNIE